MFFPYTGKAFAPYILNSVIHSNVVFKKVQVIIASAEIDIKAARAELDEYLSWSTRCKQQVIHYWLTWSRLRPTSMRCLILRDRITPARAHQSTRNMYKACWVHVIVMADNCGFSCSNTFFVLGGFAINLFACSCYVDLTIRVILWYGSKLDEGLSIRIQLQDLCLRITKELMGWKHQTHVDELDIQIEHGWIRKWVWVQSAC